MVIMGLSLLDKSIGDNTWENIEELSPTQQEGWIFCKLLWRYIDEFVAPERLHNIMLIDGYSPFKVFYEPEFLKKIIYYFF